MVAFQSDQAVQILITLKELDSNLYIWSENFELVLESWFSYQRHAVRRIAMGLNVHLSAERLLRFSDKPNVSLALYDRWLRCQTQVRTFDPRFFPHLREQFSEIISQAPDFGPAYGGLADLNNIEHIVHPGVLRTPERDRMALGYARQAVQLDPLDMGAHRCLAWSLMMSKQYEQGAMHFEVAFELNPNDSWTVIAVALMRAFGGQPERALELARVAMDMTLAPSRTHWVYQTDIQFLAGDYEAAIIAADHALGGLGTALAWRSAALAHLGRLEEAAADAARFLAGIRANWFGTGPPADEAIVRWFLHLYPLSRRADWERLRDGLALAGLSTGSAAYEEW
jgi:tetratricopeptide (TPR) repeat protein